LKRLIYDIFRRALRERVATLTVGDPATNPNLGPVINQAALDSMLGYIETGKKEGRLIAGGTRPQTSDGGYFLRADRLRRRRARRSLAQEEIFGPGAGAHQGCQLRRGPARRQQHRVRPHRLHLHQRPRQKAAARSAFHVGNLYFNRKCTGAMVGAHPFGGFNMSGTDSKAGGPDYLYLFTQAKSVAEKL
jgi:1-pyrroline-5-carboxylate dehydrogenase